jgi:hypothetical protein
VMKMQIPHNAKRALSMHEPRLLFRSAVGDP